MKLLPFIYATRNLGRSPLRLALAVGGSCLVSLLALTGEAFVSGMSRAFRSSSEPSNVLLIGAGSEESLERSEIPRGAAGEAVAGIAGVRTVAGVPWASSEIHVALPVVLEGVTLEDGGTSADLGVVRGITGTAWSVHPQVALIAGRAPAQGADEVAAGSAALSRIGTDAEHASAAIAQGAPITIMVDNRPFRVVGVMSAPGTIMDGEVWMPLQDVLVHTKRETISTVVLSLDSADPSDVELFTQRRPDLEMVTVTEAEYYSALGAFMRPVQVMVLASAALVALGGLLGGLNTMYAAFAARIRETASLQTLGYSRTAIAISMLQESLIASLAGALIAVLIAFATLGDASIRLSMGSFSLHIGPAAVLAALAAGMFVGVAGAALPALRCLRTPIPTALRAD